MRYANKDEWRKQPQGDNDNELPKARGYGATTIIRAEDVVLFEEGDAERWVLKP